MQAGQIDILLLVGIIGYTTLIAATPLILAALGGMFSERSGVVNIALEGMMLMGALMGAVGSYFTGNPWIGVFYAIIVGGLMGLIHALVSVKLKGNQIVSGTGIIIFAAGFTTVMLWVVWGQKGVSDPVIPVPEIVIPPLLDVPILGPMFGSQSPLVYIMFALIPICWFILYRTSFGLRLRAAGEDPSTLDSAGVNVETVRMIAVILSGCLAGLAGAYLSIGFGSSFSRNMVAGRGFIALAALIFGNWTPFGVLIAGLFFGFLDGLKIAIQVTPALGFLYPFNLWLRMIPYLGVIIALGIIRRSVPPKAIGVPYIKERGV
ncbi:MAG: ABC transporter permease [Promethearchaeota archaeon]